MIGYGPAEAQRLLRKIDRAVARAEDALDALTLVVPDLSIGVAVEQERVREIGHELAHAVRRRTASPAPERDA